MSNDLQKRLLEYRAKREENANHNDVKRNFKSVFSSNEEEECKESLLASTKDSDNEMGIDNLSDVDFLIEEDSRRLCNCTYMEIMYYTLCFILWATLYVVFIKLQFGTVYFIMSGLIGIYINTRTGPKKPNEVSAYSVFNKDCKSIDGTLKAEQFEKEIRYGPAILQ